MGENRKITQLVNKPTRCFIEEKITNIEKLQISTIEIYLREKKEKI